MYFFLFGINNSGTTVASQYLARQADAYLPPFGNNEGQDVPALQPIFRTRPWRRNKPIDWPFVRATWDELLAASGKSTFVEASPCMLLWVAKIRQVWSDGFRGAILTSGPYMQIASCLKNYTTPPLSPDTIGDFTDRWLTKARYQAENCAAHPDLPYLTYEAFCADPTTLNRAFNIPHDPTRMQVSGKGHHLRGKPPVNDIWDLTPRTVSFLSPDEIERITDHLVPHEDLVTSLGHQLWPDRGAAVLAADQNLAATGRATRQTWEARV